nr:hypothetical protein [uncultured Agathobaculum sp.]
MHFQGTQMQDIDKDRKTAALKTLYCVRAAVFCFHPPVSNVVPLDKGICESKSFFCVRGNLRPLHKIAAAGGAGGAAPVGHARRRSPGENFAACRKKFFFGTRCGAQIFCGRLHDPRGAGHIFLA